MDFDSDHIVFGFESDDFDFDHDDFDVDSAVLILTTV